MSDGTYATGDDFKLQTILRSLASAVLVVDVAENVPARFSWIISSSLKR